MDSQVAYRETGDSKSSSPLQKTQVQLTKEELNVLRECNKESFYFRCLPFAVIGMGATYYAVKAGHLSGHPKFGPAFKMTGAAFCGWVLGKFSYRKQCEDKFLNIENSVIGNAVRKKRGYVLRSEDEKGQFFSDDDTVLKDSNYASDSGDFHSSSGSLNFDKNLPSSELDDRGRPTLDSERKLSDSQTAPFTSYDELRRKNREEYERQQFRQGETQRPDTFRPPWNPNTEPIRRTNAYPQGETAKNTYGDTWDNPKFS